MSFPAKIISKVKRVATEQIAGSFLSGLTVRNIQGNYILMYHGVTATGSTQFNRRHASISCFRKQIRFLKKHFSVLSVEDFFKGKFDSTKPNVAITFDDGLLNNYTYAKPVLEEFKCPATFYITGLNDAGDNVLWADFVNIASSMSLSDIEVGGELFKKKNNIYFSQSSGKSLYDVIKHQKADYAYKQKVKEAFIKQTEFGNAVNLNQYRQHGEYWQLMTDLQIAETARSKYITIGSHSYYHNNLGSIPYQHAVDELQRSKKYLENLVQYPVKELAYPDGSYTPQLVDAATQLGFDVQLAADRFLFKESADNNNIKKRYGIYTVDSCLNQLFTAIKTP